MAEKIGKKAQVTLWTMLAILLVGIIIIFFTIKKEPEKIDAISENPQNLIEICTKNAVEDALKIIIPQGGFINPENFKKYNNINVSYLCYNRGYYLPCINQHPIYMDEIKTEIGNYIKPKIEKCFLDAKQQMEKRNRKVELGEMKIDAAIAPKKIYIHIEREFRIKNQDEFISFNKIDADISSALYELANIAIEIANQQAKYCYFEYNGYMILYPKYKITLFVTPDSSKMYTIEDTISKEKMNIAIRELTIPPGI